MLICSEFGFSLLNLSMDSLADKFPSIAKEWDYAMNGDLTPKDVAAGSHKTVFWRCSKCGQSYSARICNRTAPSRTKESGNCPVCRGLKIVPGYNSLKALFPEIVANEWDYDNNSLDPDTIAPHTNVSYYWKCLHGHEPYKARVNNKTSNNGGNCPKCSHQKFSPEFSLAALYPDLALQWDTAANNGKTAAEITAHSNKSFWWSCPNCGHKWKAKVGNRANGRGCPNCSKGRHTSFPEQVIFYYIKQLFPDTINGYIFHRREIDVYIPCINLGIEYDGEAYHKGTSKLLKDIEKTEYFRSNGLSIIRFRESGCPPFESSAARIIITKYDSEYTNLQADLQLLVNELIGTYSLPQRVVVDIPSIKNKIIADICTIPYDDSFEAFAKKIESTGKPLRAIWDIEANFPLTPRMVQPFSEKRVKWICPNDPSHTWENTVKSVSLGYGCTRCSGKYRKSTEEWIEAAKGIHGDKYDYSLVEFLDSKTPVTIICPKHGRFLQAPSEHLSGKGCKYCAHQSFHPKEALAIISPEIASQWDYELNKDSGYTPETIGVNHTIQFWWHCTEGKAHSFHATIAKRLSGMRCAVCHGKQMSYDRSLEFLRPDLLKEWSSENDKKPSEVSLGSEYKALWKCSNPDHPEYRASIYNRAHLNSGCPLCARDKKTTKK